MLDPRLSSAPERDDDCVPVLRRAGAAARAVAPLPATEAADLDGVVARLHATVSAYVWERRAADIALDRVLREVRDLVHDAELLEGLPDELGVLMGQVVRWTIAAYVDDPEVGHVPDVY